MNTCSNDEYVKKFQELLRHFFLKEYNTTLDNNTLLHLSSICLRYAAQGLEPIKIFNLLYSVVALPALDKIGNDLVELEPKIKGNSFASQEMICFLKSKHCENIFSTTDTIQYTQKIKDSFDEMLRNTNFFRRYVKNKNNREQKAFLGFAIVNIITILKSIYDSESQALTEACVLIAVINPKGFSTSSEVNDDSIRKIYYRYKKKMPKDPNEWINKKLLTSLLRKSDSKSEQSYPLETHLPKKT